MICYVVQGHFQAILPSWGGPWGPETTPKTSTFSEHRYFYNRPKSNPNPLPVAQNGPKYVYRSLLSHLEVMT